jgi:catechol 2,3-dioxygenase-like lactoylglutathione lyase family enzyme
MVARPIRPALFRVLLQVNDLRRSRRFYEILLGSRGRAVGGGRVYFDSGPVLVALLDSSADGGGEATPLPEPLYFSTADLEGVYRRARRLRCLSTDLIHHDPANPAGRIVVRPWGERSFYALDPTGNPLCFVDSTTLFTGASRPAPTRRRRPARGRETRLPGRSR